jgi:Nucleotidyl transferase AbiEii toxin, Type IV TA system
VIRFPATELITERARALKVPLPVVVRDLARIVEILNLREKNFFAKDSVLAGGMALRAYGSRRLTIYDADLSTRAVTAPAQIRQLLTYTSPDIEIRPAPLLPTSDQGNVWKSDPVEFDPLWLTVPIEDNERRFKVDLATYGILADGKEQPLTDPYELGLWPQEAPAVTVMRLEEIAAEKTLGWCAHRLYKHLADLAFIAERLHDQLDPRLLRDLTDGKLDTMRKLQPAIYQDLHSLADVVAALERPGPVTPPNNRASASCATPTRPNRSSASCATGMCRCSSRNGVSYLPAVPAVAFPQSSEAGAFRPATPGAPRRPDAASAEGQSRRLLSPGGEAGRSPGRTAPGRPKQLCGRQHNCFSVARMIMWRTALMDHVWPAQGEIWAWLAQHNHRPHDPAAGDLVDSGEDLLVRKYACLRAVPWGSRYRLAATNQTRRATRFPAAVEHRLFSLLVERAKTHPV